MIKICEKCKSPFVANRSTQRFCSNSCASVYRWQNKKVKSANACDNCIHQKYLYSKSLHAKVLTCGAEKCHYERKELTCDTH